jgi:hypothetical protein
MNAKKMMIACVAIFALASTASAQSENSGMTEEEMAKAILNDTTKVFISTFEKPESSIATEEVVVAGQNVNKGDTIYKIGYKYFYRGGLRKAPAYIIGRLQKTVEVRDEALVDKIDRVAAATQTSEKLAASSGNQRDTRWLEVSLHEKTDGRIVKSGVDKNGWSLHPEVGYQWSEGCNAIVGGLGVSYTWDMPFWAEVNGYVTRNMMYALAEDAGENYTAVSADALAGFKWQFGRRKNITVGILGGVIGTWNKTNSREFTDEYGNQYMMKSTHSLYTPEAGIKLSYRFPDTGNSLALKFKWTQKEYTYQNGTNERHNAFMASLLFEWGIQRHPVKTKLQY